MNEIVLDASALLALMNAERGADVVADALGMAVIGAVNLSEVATKLRDTGVPEADAWNQATELVPAVIPFDADLARVAAGLRDRTRRQGLSLGDRACLALGLVRKAEVLTADGAWRNLDVDVGIRLIRS